MSKFAIGEKVDKATDDHEAGVVIAVFPTADGAMPSTWKAMARSSSSPKKNWSFTPASASLTMRSGSIQRRDSDALSRNPRGVTRERLVPLMSAALIDPSLH